MASLNKVQIIGRLGRDPEMRYTPQGSAVTSFSVAVDRKWSNRDGSQNEETIWFRAEAWDKLGETCNQYLTKGMLVYVEGRLKPPRVYTDKNGVAQCSPEIVVSAMQMLSTKGEGSSYSSGEYEEADYSSAEPRKPAPAPTRSASPPVRNQPQPIREDMGDDEIPF